MQTPKLTLLGMPVPDAFVEVFCSADDRQDWPLATRLARRVLVPSMPPQDITPAHRPAAERLIR